MYLWFNSCAKCIIAIDDVLLRMSLVCSLGTFDGVGAAAGSNLEVVRSYDVAWKQLLGGGKDFSEVDTTHQKLQTSTCNGQHYAKTTTL